MQQSAPAFELVDTDRTDLRFQEALSELFSDDGTIYLVSGYFTYQGYQAIRDDVAAFLERSRDNELVVVVGATSDQFSARIATDLRSLDEHDQVRLYKQPRGLHAKLYFRDGPQPRCIVGSANITRVAFEYNTEINVTIERDRPDHPDLEPFREWVDELVDESTRLRRRDVFSPVLICGSVVNWSNKARILPVRNVILRAVPVVILLFLFGGMVRLI